MIKILRKINTIFNKPDYSLAREFEKAKAQHKHNVLKTKLIAYYEAVQQGQVNLPDFMRDNTPEQLAERDLRNLVLSPDGLKRFDSLYEKAWGEFAPLLP